MTVTYHPAALLQGEQPGAWGEPHAIGYSQRDVLLFAVGTGCADLCFVFERHPALAVFPSLAIRWGGAGLVIDPADLQLRAHISPQQAHVYRLSGDYNPLHIDPEVAGFGGFAAPILHGLCACGHCGQMLLGAVADGEAARFGMLKARFSSPVYPGDELGLLVWHDGPGRVRFEARVQDRTVVSDAFFTRH